MGRDPAAVSPTPQVAQLVCFPTNKRRRAIGQKLIIDHGQCLKLVRLSVAATDKSSLVQGYLGGVDGVRVGPAWQARGAQDPVARLQLPGRFEKVVDPIVAKPNLATTPQGGAPRDRQANLRLVLRGDKPRRPKKYRGVNWARVLHDVQ